MFKYLFLSFLLVLTGCRESSSQKLSKDVRLYLSSEPLSLHPQKGGNALSSLVVRHLFEGLMRIDKEGKAAFAVAKSVDISDDLCCYRFHLRPTRWSNGLPVTAYDFEYAWKEQLSPGGATSFAYVFYPIKNARKARMGEVANSEVGIHAENERTLKVTLEHPAPYFLELVASSVYAPVCKAVAEKNSHWNDEATKDYITNGPFVLDQWRHQEEIVLKKNSHYWDCGSIQVDRLIFPIIQDSQTALNLFEEGSLDWIGEPCGSIPLEAMEDLKAKKRLCIPSSPYVSWLEVNTKRPLLSSAKIRRALALSINRQEIIDYLLQGGESAAFSIVPKHLTLQKRPIFQDNHVEKAAKLFQEGLCEIGWPKELPAVIQFSYTSDMKNKSIVEAIQQHWQRALGVTVQLVAKDSNTHWTDLGVGNFDIGLSGWWTAYNDPSYNLEFLKFSEGGINGTGWEDPKYIALLDAADVERNSEKRAELLAAAERLVLDQMPVIPLYYNTAKFCKVAALKGEEVSELGDFNFSHIAAR